MRIITCTGYHGTGSSVVTDILKEFDECKSLGEYEFRFIQDPYGISDLEYNLVENNHRLNSSNAIKKYKKNIEFLSGNRFIKKYEPYFNYKFKEISYQYINDLTDLRYKSTWHQDVIERGKFFYISYKCIFKFFNFFNKKLKKNSEAQLNLLKNEEFYLSNPKEEFYTITKKYLKNLFEQANLENKEFIAFDQLVPPTNCKRYLQYFEDLKIVIVDRDPRDLFILSKYSWKDGVIPTNVDEFVLWFKVTRNHNSFEQENKAVLRMKFEDFIFNYNSSIKKLSNFIEIKDTNHIRKKEFFKPKISIKNTKLWGEFQEDEAIRRIEANLGEYCYDFDKKVKK